MSYDYELERAVEGLDDAKKTLKRTFDKTKILEDTVASLDGDVPDFEAQEGAYEYIAIDIGEFLEALFELEHALRNDSDYRHSDLPYRPCAFLEVGCGTGRNIFILKHTEHFHFHKILGFDISEAYVKYGQKRYGLKKELFVQDCMTFDYGGFDVIYFYKPFTDDNREKDFENRLIETAKRGAYIVGVFSAGLDESRLLMRVSDTSDCYKRL